MTDLFDMGSVGVFVWGAYGVSAAGLVGLAIASLRANRAAAAEVERLRPRRQRKKSGGEG